MKAQRSILLIMAVFLLSFQTSVAQSDDVVTKSDLIKSFNNIGDLDLSDDKKMALEEQNEGLVDDIFNIVDGDDTPENKKLSLKNLKEENSNKLSSLLGDDQFKKYQKQVKKSLKPYKRRMKLLKFVL